MKTPIQLFACVVILVLCCGQLDAKRRSGGGGRIRTTGGVKRVRNPIYPKQQWTKSADYRSPGYGTSYGTNFAGGVGRYGGKGFSKKPVGLGVGPGFIGGSAIGTARTRATYGVYHRYSQYRLMLLIHGGHSNTYRHSNHCYGNCPFASHCEWGFCECNRGYMKRYGRCKQNWKNQRGSPPNFDPFIDCSDNSDCQEIDMNLICPANSTDNTRTTVNNMTENINTTNITNISSITNGIPKCECRKDMRWNEVNRQCQLYLDVDCSSFTYDTKPSAIIIQAVKEMLAKTSGNKETETVGTTEKIIEPYDLEDLEDDHMSKDDTSVVSEVTTETPVNAKISMSPNETLSNSLLSSIDPTNTTEDELREAFCRDIDSFSWQLSKPTKSSSGPRGSMVTFSGIPLQVSVFLACISYGYALLHQ